MSSLSLVLYEAADFLAMATQIIRSLHNPRYESATNVEHNWPNEMSISISYNQHKPELNRFKAVDCRLTACNGDCGSDLSIFIQHCVHPKVV